MVVAVIVLAVIAAAAVIAAVVLRSRLGAQRQLTTAADERSAQRAMELTTASEALAEADRARTAADERAAAAEQATLVSAEQAQLADQRADESESGRQQAQDEAAAAVAARQAAEEQVAAAERRLSELAAARSDESGGGVDPAVLWALERSRSERTWRMAVAPGPDSESVFTADRDPLVEALQVELDAAREEVGAIVELDAELPQPLTPGGSVLTLRAAQELLAGVVRRADETTLVVRTEGRDVVVAVRALDEDGQPVTPVALELPSSLDIESTADGVRIRNAVAS